MTVKASEPGFTLSKLKADDYHQMFDEQAEETIHKAEPDLAEGQYFVLFGAGHNGAWFRRDDVVSCPDGTIGKVDGIAVQDGHKSEFVRVSGRLYHWSKLKHV